MTQNHAPPDPIRPPKTIRKYDFFSKTHVKMVKKIVKNLPRKQNLRGRRRHLGGAPKILT